MANSTMPQDARSLNDQPNRKGNLTAWREGDVLLGTYEVKEIIAQGGMGIIYRIHHHGWGIDLAVKCPHSDKLNNRSIIDNYFRECETWIDLGLHPNIATCYYVRNIDGLPRIFSEFVEGGSLKDWISTQTLYGGGKNESLETILDIATQVAWGLNYAHHKNIIHQDVKPSNILIKDNKVAKVTDFGVSRARSIIGSYESGQGTIFAPFGGMTPEYCSPEQANKTLVSRKTDIWSWGISVLEMFTGEITWISGILAPQILTQYLSDGQIPDHIPRMPKDISNLLSKCFEINPEKRPENFEQISNELIAVYSQIIGSPYKRRFPEDLKLMADNLNNKGVSLWDLEKYQEAYNSWDQATIQEPLHPQATYNKLLTLWRAGQVTDQAVVQNLEAVVRDRPVNEIAKIMLGDIHLERGDLQNAKKIFENISFAQFDQTINERREYIRGNWDKSRFLKQRLKNSPSIIGIKFKENDQEAISVTGTKNFWGALEGGSNVQFWDLNNGSCDYSFHIPNTISTVSFYIDKYIMITGRIPSNRDFETKNFRDKINVWDLKTGEKIKSIDGFIAGVTMVAIGADGSSILSGGYSKEAGIWNASSGELCRELIGHSRTITCGCFTSDMKYCFTGEGFINLDGFEASRHGICIKMWRISDGSMIREFVGHQDSVRCICVNNENSFLVSTSDDKTIKMWDISTGKCVTTLKGHTSSVNTMILFQNDTHLLTGSSDNTVRLWNLVDSRCIYTFEGHSASVAAVTVNKVNDLILSSGGDSLILWSSGYKLPSYQAPFALCNAKSTEMQITAQENFESLLTQAKEAFSSKNYSRSAAIIKAARTIPNQARHPEAIKVWRNLYKVAIIYKFKSAWLVENYSDDQAFYERNQELGKTIALKYINRGRYHVVDIPTRRIIREVISKRNINRICLSPDATYVFTAEGGVDDELAVWNLANGSCFRSFTIQRFGISCCEFDQSGKYVITGGGKGIVKKWDISQGKCVQEFLAHKSPINVIYMCKQSRRLVTGSGRGSKSENNDDNTVKVWDSDTGKNLFIFDAHTDKINCFSISQKEEFLFSASKDCKIKMWDLRDGREIRSFNSHTGDVTCVDISPNQKYLVSGSWDKSIILWDIQNGEIVFTAKFDEPVLNVNFSQYGDFLLVNTWGNVLHKFFIDWDLEIGLNF